MLININEIKVTDRIRKDFGNIQELADDIKQNGLINPPVVTPDSYELIAGERRLHAMKLLGYNQIEVRPMAVKDAEHQLNLEISENETRKDFSKAERIDYARRLERVESLKSKGRQGERNDLTSEKNFAEVKRTTDIVAEKLNIGSGKQYEKEKLIVENKEMLSAEDFENWDEGKLSTNKVFIKIKEQLNEKENQISGYELKLQKVKELEDEIEILNDELINRPSTTVEVKPSDYDTVKSEKEKLSKSLLTKNEELAKVKLEFETMKQSIKIKHQGQELDLTVQDFGYAINEFAKKITPYLYSMFEDCIVGCGYDSMDDFWECNGI